MRFERLIAALVGAAALMSLIAWQVQASAASDLAMAEEIQRREVPDEGGAPPSLDEYKEVLTTLDDSIEIRRAIDDLLERIESTVASLGGRQQEAVDVVRQALVDLEGIAVSLDSSLTAAGLSTAELASLSRRLARSTRLARAIAAELEELDESFGPSAGGRP